MNILKIIFLLAASYLIGSVSVSISMSKKLFGSDVRSHGSGNAGATNMARVFGWSAGVLTLAADAAKGVLSMLLGKWLFGDAGLAAAGIACIVGHCYPALHGFKGGKGVSVGAAIAFMVDVRVGFALVIVFAVVVLCSKKVSLASVSAAVGLVIFSIIFGVTIPRLILAVVSSVLVIVRHSSNIKRLISGTEPDFKANSVK